MADLKNMTTEQLLSLRKQKLASMSTEELKQLKAQKQQTAFKGFGGGQPVPGSVLRSKATPTGATRDFSPTPGELVGQFAAGGSQGMTFGTAQPLLKKIGAETSLPVTPQGKTAREVGRFVGGVGVGRQLGALGALGKAISPKFISPATMLKAKKSLPMMKSIAAGAATGFAINPSDLELVPLNDRKRYTNAAIGGAMAGLLSFASKVSKNYSDAMLANKDASFEQFGKSIVKHAKQSKGMLTNKFGKEIKILSDANPGKRAEIFDELLQLDDIAQSNPKVKSLIKRIPMLNKLINDPKSATDLTVGELQTLKNSIQNKIPKNITSDDLAVLDFVDGISDKQLAAFPGMKPVRDAYRVGIEDWKLVRGALQESKVLSTIKNIKDKGPEGAMQRQALSRTLGRVSPELMDRMTDISSNLGAQRIAVNISRRILEASILGTVLKFTIGRE